MHADTDIDLAIAEFELAVGYEIKAIQRERHRRTVEPLKELCEWRARQIMFEVSGVSQ